MSKPGESRQKVLDAYRDNPSGTLREFAYVTGLAISSVSYHLRNLEKEGLIYLNRQIRQQSALKASTGKRSYSNNVRPFGKRYAIVLKAIQENPDATMRQLEHYTRLRSTSIWYYLHTFERKDALPGIGDIVKRLMREAKENKRSAARGPRLLSLTIKKTTRERDQELIDRVVAKAEERAAAGKNSAGVDVVHDFRHSFSIRGSRVG